MPRASTQVTPPGTFGRPPFAEVIVAASILIPRTNPRLMAWARDYLVGAAPLSAGGGHVNIVLDEGDDTRRAPLGRRCASTARPRPGALLALADRLLHEAKADQTLLLFGRPAERLVGPAHADEQRVRLRHLR
jgi:hypothetical protein